ncbi:MFS transporter [Desulfosarcina sp.]|uniref:MFS transporter n=1 Tax=Desulfosarcina sp. TaxID=2027861 RepID=UPI0035698196
MIPKKHRRWIIFLISCLLFTYSQFYRSSIAVISPNLIEELDLDTEDLGLISAAFFYAFAAMQIPVGLYLDRVGPRALMTVLSLVAVAGATLFAYGESAVALIVGRSLLGVGMACNLMGPLKLITTWFSPLYFATLSATFVSVGTAGNIAAATPLVWLTEWFGWRTTFLLFAISNLIIAIVFYLIARDHPDDSPVSRPSAAATVSLSVTLGGLLPLFTRRDYWLISMGTFFRYGIYASVQALWAGPFLMVTMGLSQMMTGNLLLAMSIGLIIGSPVCGWISDTMLNSRKTVIIAGLALMACILVTLAVLPGSTALLTLLALFFGFGFSSGSGQIMYAHIKERLPHEKAGAAMTGINFFTMTGGAFFLHGLGWAIKTFYPGGSLEPGVYRVAFVLFGVCLVVTGLLYSLTIDDRRALRKPMNNPTDNPH